MFNRPSKKVYESVFNLSDPRVKQAQEIANRCRKPFFLIRNALGGIDFVGVEVATLDEHGETRVPLAIVHPEELPAEGPNDLPRDTAGDWLPPVKPAAKPARTYDFDDLYLLMETVKSLFQLREDKELYNTPLSIDQVSKLPPYGDLLIREQQALRAFTEALDKVHTASFKLSPQPPLQDTTLLIREQMAAASERLQKIDIWLPRLLSDYDNQARLQGFTPDIAASMLQARTENPARHGFGMSDFIPADLLLKPDLTEADVAEWRAKNHKTSPTCYCAECDMIRDARANGKEGV